MQMKPLRACNSPVPGQTGKEKGPITPGLFLGNYQRRNIFFQTRAVCRAVLEFLLTLIQVPIMLDAGDAEAGHTRPINRPLPSGKFFDR